MPEKACVLRSRCLKYNVDAKKLSGRTGAFSGNSI